MITRDHISHYVSTPIEDFEDKPRVEVFIFENKTPKITSIATQSVIEASSWPYKLSVVDTSMYPAAMSRIYNHFLSKSDCEYVSIVCSDAAVPNGWLNTMMEEMVKDSKMGGIGPMTYNAVNEEMIRLAEKPAGVYEAGWEWASLPVVIWRKSALENVGWYDNNYFLYGHDPELYRRLAGHGYGIYIDTRVIARHMGGTTTKRIFTPEDLITISEHNKEVDGKNA